LSNISSDNKNNNIDDDDGGGGGGGDIMYIASYDVVSIKNISHTQYRHQATLRGAPRLFCTLSR